MAAAKGAAVKAAKTAEAMAAAVWAAVAREAAGRGETAREAAARGVVAREGARRAASERDINGVFGHPVAAREGITELEARGTAT